MIQLYFLLTIISIAALVYFFINSINESDEEERRLIKSIRRHYFLKSVKTKKPVLKEHIQISQYKNIYKKTSFMDVG